MEIFYLVYRALRPHVECLVIRQEVCHERIRLLELIDIEDDSPSSRPLVRADPLSSQVTPPAFSSNSVTSLLPIGLLLTAVVPGELNQGGQKSCGPLACGTDAPGPPHTRETGFSFPLFLNVSIRENVE